MQVEKSRDRSRILPLALIASVLLHLVLFLIVAPFYRPVQPADSGPVVVEVLAPGEGSLLDDATEAEVVTPTATPTPLPDKPDGQIVEVPEPLQQEKPDEARFLAENNHKVDEETATPLSAVNPEIVTPEFHPDQKVELESAADGEGKAEDLQQPMEIENPLVLDKGPDGDYGQKIALNTSIGANAFQPPEEPAKRSREATVRGAPQNDYLRNIKIDNSTNLNTQEYLFQSFYNRVKRQVNPFWIRYLHEANPTERIDRKQYTTVVNLILTSHGDVEGVEITRVSGVGAFDEAVTQAFKDAGPYLNPPAGMVEADGRIHLDDLAFTVTINAGRAVQMYIDPRSHIKYPGIEHGPR